MNIAIIAHDKKKELMVQFCIAYSGILARHTLVATGVTGKMVSEATNLNVHRFYSGSQGGDQQIAARLQYNEIDMLLFFRDPITAKASEPNDRNLLILCDENNPWVPFGTCLGTAPWP
ncbi:MAG: methylglyoxal synthase, partial [Oscillospiraceae bacterium]